MARMGMWRVTSYRGTVRSTFLMAWLATMLLCYDVSAAAQQYLGLNFPTAEQVEADIQRANPGESEEVIAGATAGRLMMLGKLVWDLPGRTRRQEDENASRIRDGYSDRSLSLQDQWAPKRAKNCILFLPCQEGRFRSAFVEYGNQPTRKIEAARLYFPQERVEELMPMLSRNEGMVRISFLPPHGSSNSSDKLADGLAKIVMGMILLISIPVFGFRLRNGLTKRTNEHGVAVFGSAGSATGYESLINLFRGYVPLALMGGIILIIMGLD